MSDWNTQKERINDAYAVCRLSPGVMTLACDLQRAAFPGDKKYDGEFQPAPVYAIQAVSIASDESLRIRIEEALGWLS